MYFYLSKLDFIVILMAFVLLNACTTDTNYAPVKTGNMEFAEDNQNLLISKQSLNKGNQFVSKNIRNYPAVKKRRTFHATALSSSDGHQRSFSWNQKSPAHNITVARKLKFYDHADDLYNNNQQDIALKNASSRPKKTNPSELNNTRHKDISAQKKQQTELAAKKKLKRQKKSIISIDNSNKLELNFSWPIKGRVLKNFSPSHNKGIDIAGKKGQSVKATEAGKVVYGGQGLIGFGKLLIIKHNDDYLSAYANNSKLLVNEGQHVQKGQAISEVGDHGIKRSSLHFEIRKKGKPVNPLKLLPKK